MNILESIEQRRKEAILRNSDLHKAFEYRLNHSVLIFVLTNFFNINYHTPNPKVINNYTPSEQKDITLMEELEKDINNYLEKYCIDFSDLNSALDSTQMALYNYKPQKKSLQKMIKGYKENRKKFKIINLAISVMLNRKLALICFSKNNFELAFHYYSDYQIDIRFMEIEATKITPIQKNNVTNFQKSVVKNLALKIWEYDENHHVLMTDTVVNLLIEKLPNLISKNENEKIELEKIKVNAKLKRWFKQIGNIIPPEIIARGSKGATSKEESKKRHELLSQIKREMKHDFEKANQKLASFESNLNQ